MTTMTARKTGILKAVSLLPLLALTACAGSQRFVGSDVYGSRDFSQPTLAPAPPVSSAPVTSEPLPPPPGSYPTASAPPATSGALPPPQDPFYQPGPAAPAAPAPTDGVPTLRVRTGLTIGGTAAA